MVVAMAQDVRVLLVKLCDCLDNRSLVFLGREKVRQSQVRWRCKKAD